MTRQSIIERTIKSINQLPEDKAEEIADFADFVTKRFEENRLTAGILHMASKSQAFAFLNDEEDHYSEADLKGPAVRIAPSLDRYNDTVLFPDKLAKANENLKKSGFPKLPNKK